MAHLHSHATHEQLVRRIPEITGRPLDDWLDCLQDGPGLVRSEERARWLRTQHDLSYGYAAAIVHEQNLRRAHRSFA